MGTDDANADCLLSSAADASSKLWRALPDPGPSPLDIVSITAV
jgi:hypothetical protein